MVSGLFRMAKILACGRVCQ